MKHYFDECPDCGEEYSKIGNMPELNRCQKIYSNNGDIVRSYIKAICHRCGWETKLHNNVGECVREWNSTYLNVDIDCEETDTSEYRKYCNECACYIEGEYTCSKGILADEFEAACSQFVAKQ